jgi:hypothetical protein
MPTGFSVIPRSTLLQQTAKQPGSIPAIRILVLQLPIFLCPGILFIRRGGTVPILVFGIRVILSGSTIFYFQRRRSILTRAGLIPRWRQLPILHNYVDVLLYRLVRHRNTRVIYHDYFFYDYYKYYYIMLCGERPGSHFSIQYTGGYDFGCGDVAPREYQLELICVAGCGISICSSRW